MSEPKYLQLNLEEMLEFHAKLGDQVIMPYSKEVFDAWSLIRQRLTLKIHQIENEELEMFLGNAFSALQNAETVEARRTILHSIYNFRRQK